MGPLTAPDSRLLTAAVCLLLLVAACVGDPPEANLSKAQRRRLAALEHHHPPSNMIRTDARFGSVSLVGYVITPRTLTHRAGSSFKLSLVWKVSQPLAAGWRQFTHLTDQGGRLLANLDASGPLRALAGVTGTPLPPSRWTAGRYIVDELRVSIPHDAPDKVLVLTGFYQGRQRLAATGKAIDAARSGAVVRLSVETKDSSIPELLVPRLRSTATIGIDGVLDEPAWAQAADTGPFVNVSTGRPARGSPIQGRAKLLYDSRYLYVAFEVQDPTLRGGFPAGAVDPHLWERDTVEIMIDPDGDGDNRDYYEIQINPQNLVFDSRFDSYNRPRHSPRGPFGHQNWSAKLTSGVKLRGSLDNDADRDSGYTVEAKIPWASFAKAMRAPPRVGDRWRMNFYAMQNNGGVAWSPIMRRGNFHKASRFGRVHWSKKQVP